MLFLLTDGDRAPLAIGTGLKMVASLTTHRELDLDHRIGPIIKRRRPTDACPPYRAGRVLRLPIDREIRNCKALPSLCLTTIIASYWFPKVDLNWWPFDRRVVRQTAG